MLLHHAALFVRDVEASLRFYRDGLGLDVLFDREFDGDWQGLLQVASTRLRAVVLGDPERPDGGQVELLGFPEPLPAGSPPGTPTNGTVLLSFHVDIAAVEPTLHRLGVEGIGRTTLRRGNTAVTVRDPDGILVELIDVGQRRAG